MRCLSGFKDVEFVYSEEKCRHLFRAYYYDLFFLDLRLRENKEGMDLLADILAFSSKAKPALAKKLVAQAVHRAGSRKEGSFVDVLLLKKKWHFSVVPLLYYKAIIVSSHTAAVFS